MRLSRILLAAVLVSTIIGVVAGSVTSDANDARRPAVTVPNSRVGDVVQYRWADGKDVFVKVQALTNHLDASGRMREVVLIRTGEGNGTPQETHAYDLAGGALVAIERWENETTAIDDRTRRTVSLGPFGTGFDWTWEPALYQGRTFRVGEDLQDWKVRLFPARLFLDDCAEPTTFSGRVGAAGTVQGEPAVRLDTSLSVRLGCEGSAEANETRRFDSTTWITAASPYPVLTEIKEWRGGTVVSVATNRLAGFSTGAAEISWRNPEGAPAVGPAFERSPTGVRHPATGKESSMEYTLEAALENVEQDPTLVRYKAWRQSHPGAILVGFYYHARGPGTVTQFSRYWDLRFADASGAGFKVEARWTSPGSPFNEEIGEQEWDLTFQQLAENPITLAAAEASWRALASHPYRTIPVRHARWGVTSSQDEGYQTLNLGFVDTPGQVASNDLRSSQMTVNASTGRILRFEEFSLDALEPPRSLPALEDPEPKEAAPITLKDTDLDVALVAGASALLLFLAVYFYPAIKFATTKGLLLVPGYARLKREELLDNKIRDAVLETLRADPGLSMSDIARRVAVGWGTIVYHLDVLRRNKLVNSLVDGRMHRFFPADSVNFSERGQVAALQHERTRQLYDLIAEEPGLAQQVLAQRAGVAPASAFWHLKRLEDAGLVGRVRKGRSFLYYSNRGRPGATATDAPSDIDVV